MVHHIAFHTPHTAATLQLSHLCLFARYPIWRNMRAEHVYVSAKMTSKATFSPSTLQLQLSTVLTPPRTVLSLWQWLK